MSQFHAGPADLARRAAVIDDFDDYVRDDSRLATWAFINAPEPVSERSLGAFAAWACEVVRPVE
jgi:hypothetical protein